MGLAGVSPPMTVEDELADRIDAEVRVERAGPGCRRDGTAEFTVTCEVRVYPEAPTAGTA